jgi:hypothetical protein
MRDVNEIFTDISAHMIEGLMLHNDLCEEKEIACACKVKELICDVDEELKRCDRLFLKLQALKFDTANMLLMQDDLHEKYKKMTKEIGIDIC